MMQKYIETLIYWLVAALLISTFGSSILEHYTKSVIEPSNASIPFEMSPANFLLLVSFFTFLVKSLVSIVIAVWIFRVAQERKAIWAVLGLLAGWWALPLFIYYWHYYQLPNE